MGLRAYPGAELDVWEYDGPIYGDETAPMNLHKTFTDFMLNDMNYNLMTEGRVTKVFGQELSTFIQARNELAMYTDPKSGLVVAKWADDIFVRGQRKASDKFWKAMEKRWELKSWGYVQENNSRIFCSKEITVERKDGIKW